MRSNKTLYETALEVAYNDRKETMEKDDSHKVLLYKEAFSPVYTGYEFIYEDAQDDRDAYLKKEKKKSDMQKYWDQYYNCERDNVSFATSLYEPSQPAVTSESPKKNTDMKQEFISKKKAKAKSFFWALLGLIVGAVAGVGAYIYFIL